MKQIGVGIAGTGWIARAHVTALRRLPGVALLAVCGRDAARTEAFANENGIGAWHTNIDAMLQTPGIQAVHNCTDNASHDGVNRKIIDRRLHVYAEKPLSDSAENAFAIWQAAETADIVHGLNHQYRMFAAVQDMRARVQDGGLGSAFFVGGRYHQQSGLLETDFKPRMTQPGVSWALADIGSHWIDTACCVLDKRITRVFAALKTIYPERPTPEGRRVQITTEDLALLMVEFEGGAQGMASISKVSAGHMNDLALTVDGANCSFSWELESPDRLMIGYRGKPRETLQVSPDLTHAQAGDLVTAPGGHVQGWHDALYLSAREFYGAVRGEITKDNLRCATFADGYQGMAVIEAAMRSAQSGRWETVIYNG